MYPSYDSKPRSTAVIGAYPHLPPISRLAWQRNDLITSLGPDFLGLLLDAQAAGVALREHKLDSAQADHAVRRLWLDPTRGLKAQLLSIFPTGRLDDSTTRARVFAENLLLDAIRSRGLYTPPQPKPPPRPRGPRQPLISMAPPVSPRPPAPSSNRTPRVGRFGLSFAEAEDEPGTWIVSYQFRVLGRTRNGWRIGLFEWMLGQSNGTKVVPDSWFKKHRVSFYDNANEWRAAGDYYAAESTKWVQRVQARFDTEVRLLNRRIA